MSNPKQVDTQSLSSESSASLPDNVPAPGETTPRPTKRRSKVAKPSPSDTSPTSVPTSGRKGRKASPNKVGPAKQSRRSSTSPPKLAEPKQENHASASFDPILATLDAMIAEKRGNIHEYLFSLRLQGEKEWTEMKTRLASIPSTGSDVLDERRCRDEIAEVASDFMWPDSIGDRLFELAAWSWPFRVSELIEPTGDTSAQIARLADWARCLSRLNRMLPEYAEWRAHVVELDSIGFWGNPHLEALQRIREAELDEFVTRLHHGMGGRWDFKNSVEQVAKQTLAIEDALAAGEAAESRSAA